MSKLVFHVYYVSGSLFGEYTHSDERLQHVLSVFDQRTLNVARQAVGLNMLGYRTRSRFVCIPSRLIVFELTDGVPLLSTWPEFADFGCFTASDFSGTRLTYEQMCIICQPRKSGHAE